MKKVPSRFALPLAIALLLPLQPTASASDNPYVKTLTEGGGLRLHVTGNRGVANYRPPASIVSFPIEFAPAADPELLSVTTRKGAPVDFQLSDQRFDDAGSLRFARVHVFGDPRGEGSEFVLKSGAPHPRFARPIFAWQEADQLFLDTGAQVAAIPNLRALPGEGDPIPGPLRSLGNGEITAGRSRIDPGKRKLSSIRTHAQERGPLFSVYVVDYQFDNGGSYSVAIRAFRDTPYIEVSETIRDLSPEDGVRFLLEFEGFKLTSKAQRPLSPKTPHATATGPGGRDLAVFSRRDARWSESKAIRLRNIGSGVLVDWPLAAPAGVATRHVGLALHDAKAALAPIAAHPPGRPPRSADTFASWLYHYHQKLPLEVTKDWITSGHGDLKPWRLFKAYRIARARAAGQYRELAAIASEVPDHPLSREWLAQAATAPQQRESEREISGISLGEFSLSASHAHGGNRRRSLSPGDDYRVFIDTRDDGNVRAAWPESTPRHLAVVAPGALLTDSEGARLHEAEGGRSIAVGSESPLTVNGVNVSRPLQAVPPADALEIATSGRTDQLFLPGDDGRLQADGSGWAFDGEFGVISGAAENADTLSLLSGSGATVRNRIATGLLTLETEGEGIAVSARLGPKPDAAAEPAPFPLSGRFHNAGPGTLRLRFTEPEPAVPPRRGRLQAFWKFNETEGREAADFKAPQRPAQIVGGEPKRIKGVGFDEVGALALDGSTHVETFFDTPLSATCTISMWIQAKGSGVVWTKSGGDRRKPQAGSRFLHIDAEGRPVATLVVGEGGAAQVLTGKQVITDGAWHHLVWASEGGSQRLFVNAELEAEGVHEAVAAPRVPLRIAAAARIPSAGGKPKELPGLVGAVDNIRIYDKALRDNQIAGIFEVGQRLQPIVITSTPKTRIRVGETFRYALEFTGVDVVQFRINGLADWMKFEGLITGTPTADDIGVTDRVILTGLSPWGPAQQEFRVEVLPPLVGEEWKFYVDGKTVPVQYAADWVEAQLPEGAGRWSFGTEPPPPQTPTISGASIGDDEVHVRIEPTGGAERYSIEISGDGGASWEEAAGGKGNKHRFTRPADGGYQLRAKAHRGEQSSPPSLEFPLTIDDAVPPAPGAPAVAPVAGGAKLRWSPVEGAGSYRLQRRLRGAGDDAWQVIYTGRGTTYHDRSATGVIAPYRVPGYQANADKDLSEVTIYEYALSAVNGNGESERGPAADTDPRGWR